MASYNGKSKRRGSKHNKSGNIVPKIFNTASIQPGRAAKLAAIRRPEPVKEPITIPAEVAVE